MKLNKPAKTYPKMTSLLVAVMGILFLTLFITAQSPSFFLSSRPTGTDSSVFIFNGMQMLNGKVPYVDLFDHKGPLIFLFNALGALIGGVRGIWYVEFVFIFATLIITFILLQKVSGKLPSILMMLCVTALISQGYEGGNYTEVYGLLFGVLAVYGIVDYADKEKMSRITALLFGASCGAAFLLKLTLIVFWAPFFLLFIGREIHAKCFRGAAMIALLVVLGFVVIVLPVVIWLAAIGALSECYQQMIVFNGEYASFASKTDIIYAFLYFTTSNIGFVVALISSVFFLIGTKLNKKSMPHDKGNRLRLLTPTYLIVAIITLLLVAGVTSLTGREYDHYSLILLPCYLVPFMFIAHMIDKLLGHPGILEKSVTAFIAFFLMWQIVLPDFEYGIKRAVANLKGPSQEQAVLISRVTSLSSADDPIVVFGNDCWIYLASDRDSATSYPYQPFSNVMLSDDPSSNSYTTRLKDFINQVDTAQPTLIVVRHDLGTELPFKSADRYDLVYEDDEYYLFAYRATG
jgi:4-amino-4-deoxy-L-arabinose transferase-like glycosyltransferase